ncbi:hypothetical protein KAR91_76095 [Candidatus Pacearchaeota archaeon]|nr:hypothetical protein [Candidatus Pacearchaeota archaeon]
MKKWMVTDTLCGIEESFETEEEAREYAEKILLDHREEAAGDEWDDEVGNLRVYELKYKASIVKEWKGEEDKKDYADYGLVVI